MKQLIDLARNIPVLKEDLNLKNTLINGQAFQWKLVNEDDQIYKGVFKQFLLTFSYDQNGRVVFENIPKENEVDLKNNSLMSQLNDYFQLNIDMKEKCKMWSEKDVHFSKIYEKIKGLRILRQDPLECLISFICSQNNNIPRITQILTKFRAKFGNLIQKDTDGEFYSFPEYSQICKIQPKQLEDIGLGYRAKYIEKTIKQLQEKGGVEYLLKLRQKQYQEVKSELLEFQGIGNKVADCVALFSLDQKECIPVDTHVFQIYHKVYKQKELKISKENYLKITQFFNQKFGEYSGWAHSYLFTADLNSFKDVISDEQQKPKAQKKIPQQSSQINDIKPTTKNLKQKN